MSREPFNTDKSHEAAPSTNGPDHETMGHAMYLLQVFVGKQRDLKTQTICREAIDFAKRLCALRNPDWLAKQLAADSDASLSIPRAQAAVILALGLMCELQTPGFDFYSLVESALSYGQSQEAKMYCLLFYFYEIHQKVEELKKADSCESDLLTLLTKAVPGNILIHRRKTAPLSMDSWRSIDVALCNFKVNDIGTIEDAQGMLQVDFANKYIGGGVLGFGCVQEEIRFVINPECLITLYFSHSPMSAEEAIIILGTRQYTNYSGYARSFRCRGPFEDTTEVIEHANDTYIATTITAIDALECPPLLYQFSKSGILRELNKAYAGFRFNPWEGANASLATGNWGCGAFGGDIHLKSMIQWLAATAAGRTSMNYFTFNDPGAHDLERVADAVLDRRLTVGKLLEIIEQYPENRVSRKGLFHHILSQLEEMDQNRD